jgi:hypothetical protein
MEHDSNIKTYWLLNLTIVDGNNRYSREWVLSTTLEEDFKVCNYLIWNSYKDHLVKELTSDGFEKFISYERSSYLLNDGRLIKLTVTNEITELEYCVLKKHICEFPFVGEKEINELIMRE